jgi:molybdenum cofactor cytidylyltransferase
MYSSPVNSFTLATHKIGIVLLAAGRGSRMGGDVPKVLLPMQDGRPMLLHAVENAVHLEPLELIVVVRPDILPIIQGPEFPLPAPFSISGTGNFYLRNLSEWSQLKSFRAAFGKSERFITYIPNPRYEEGMGTSLALGVSALSTISPQTEACLILLGDEPSIPPAIIQRLVEAYALTRPAITIPVYGTQPGPPTVFSSELFPDLTLLEGDTGGRQLLTKYPNKIVRVPFHENDRPKDIDTPEDYNSLEPSQ